MKRLVLVVIALALAAACGPGAKGGPAMNNRIGGNDLPKPESAVVSAAILEREPVANEAQVKHILISWKDLADAFGGRIDPRAAKRTKAEAEAEVTRLVDELGKGGDFDSLMQDNSEDSGSALSGRPMKVTPDAQLVIEFRQLSLRLNVGEIGVCQSEFGFHIIKRYE